MPYNLKLLANLVLALSLGIGLSSAVLGVQWQRKAAALQATIGPLEKEVSGVRSAVAAVDGTLAAGAVAEPLTSLLPLFMLDLFNQRSAYGVSITTVLPTKGGNAQALSTAELAEPVGLTPLNSVSLKVTGAYRYYPDLVRYLTLMQEKPVAISQLQVSENTFEVIFRVFGTNTD